MTKGLRGTSPGLAAHGYVLVLFISLAAAAADPAQVKVNRALPQTEPPATSLEFSGSPTTEEILRAWVFEEPLVPIGGEPTPAENAALAAALRGYAQRNGPDDFVCLTGFLDQHPDSPWAAALLTDLGLEYYSTAHYSLALEAWDKAWSHAEDARDASGYAVVNRALSELAYLYARLGRMTELEALLKSVQGRVLFGGAAVRMTGAREALWMMKNRPEVSFRCGPLALQSIKHSLNPKASADMAIFNSASTQKGFSLPQVVELSKKVGLNYQMAFRERGGDFIVPSVVHWKVGHYAAIVRQVGDRYLVQDPTFGNTVWPTRQALEAETSGYSLIPSGELPPGWRSVDAIEGARVWGKGVTTDNDSDQITCRDLQTGTCGSPDCQGMAVSSVHLMAASLQIRDSPVGYTPPVGPPVRLMVRYNQRDARDGSSAFGLNWTCDWFAWITDNPQSPLADVKYQMGGGGARAFTGFDTNTQTFAFQQYDQTLLTRTGTNSYELLSPDGSKKIFAQPDGRIGTSRNVYLTQLVDPQGNAVTFSYDTNLNLVAVTDAIGQVTTLTYGDPAITNSDGSAIPVGPFNPYRIKTVTDPFGRSATFDYVAFTYDYVTTFINGEPHVTTFPPTAVLRGITDVIGLTSQVTFIPEVAQQYAPTNDVLVTIYSPFVTSLVTPYGTNTFLAGGGGTNGNTRFVETHYPDGSRERVEYNQTPNLGIPNSDPAASVPQGMNTYNTFLYARNTYYWSRNACAQAYGDYTKARVYHWLHNLNLTTTSGMLESTKEPLEGRVWYDYPGQSAPYFIAPTSRPQHVGRVLDDGSTQLYTYGYNGFGHVTNIVDPAGRTFSYDYATNGIDLVGIRQARAGNNELLFKATYNSQHQPLTVSDASGQTNIFTYNARGQLLTARNPKNETTSYAYDTNGYLVAVDGPLPGTNDIATATYDAFGRVWTKTDVSGYTLSFEYDALDHLTKITHPDSTFEQITYNRLDPVVIQDRAGRQTSLEYDPLRQLTKRTDPLNRVTLFQWCSCGDIESLTDPMGRTTTWQKDVQNRLVSKQYGDGSQVNYFYENTTSRIRQIIDEKLQGIQYSYNPDGTIRSIAYANASVPTPSVTFTYDPDYERVTAMTDGTGTTVYSYNPITSPPSFGAGRLAAVDGPLPSDTISYSYDELGRRVSTAINGVAEAVTYDAAGRVIGETNALGSFSYAYDGSSDRLLSESFPNGQTTTHTYASLLQDLALQRITHQVGPMPLSEFVYGRDVPAHRITTWSQQADSQPPNVYSLGYDDANELLWATVTNSGTQVNAFGYNYDPAGNRLTEQVGVSNYTATYNALNQITTTTASSAAWTNEWEAANRLVAVQSGNERSELTYDGLGRLASIRLTTNGSQANFRRFVWGPDGVSEERDAAGVVTKRFFGQGVQLVTGTNAGLFYYTRDHLGSIRELTDGSGNVRARYAYDPFGRRTKVSGDVDADFGFAGMFWSAETGLSLTPARPYSADLGRWLTRDPLDNAEMEQGPNLYAYVGSNPVNLVDPSGLQSTECCQALKNRLQDIKERVKTRCEQLKREADEYCQHALADEAVEQFKNHPALEVFEDWWSTTAYFAKGRCESKRWANHQECLFWEMPDPLEKDYVSCLEKGCPQQTPSCKKSGSKR